MRPIDKKNTNPVAWGGAAVRRMPSPSLLLFLADALVVVGAFYAGVGLRFGFDYELAIDSVGPLGFRAIAFAACVVVGLLSMGLYRPRQRPTATETAVRIGIGVVSGAVLNVILFYWVPHLSFGRGALALVIGATMVLVFSARVGMLRLIDFNPIKRRVVVLGAGDVAVKVRRLRRRADRRRFDVVGFVALSGLERQQAARLGIEPVITVEEARRIMAGIDEIVVAVDDRRGNLPLDFLLQAKQRGIPVSELVDFLERETECLDLDILRPSWLLYEKSSQTDVAYRWLKRCFDLAFSLLLLALLSPVLLLTAVAILLEDGPGRPILYRQERVGRGGRTFALLKFRSMRTDAERDSGPRWAQRGDPRVTRVGKVLRRFRLDELPQLVNVLKGDMSVVGPRPERPAFVESLSRELPLYFYRHGVRPGLTGWAQLNFPYGASVEDARTKLTYDLYYIKNTNIVTDLLILLQTAEVVIWGRGTSMAGNATGPDDAADERVALPPAVEGSRREQDVA